MKAAVRCNALTMPALRAQEKHGKRLDASSQKRRVRDVKPLVAGGLDLSDLLAAHTAGTKKNAAAAKVALHFIIRFPPEILTDDAPTPYRGKSKEDRLRLMARQARKFVNDAHGGNAVFAVRVDRDEAGETIVDLFACPKYTKITKAGDAEWTSLTKFGKALAMRHQKEILRRSGDQAEKNKGKPITSPRAVGMSLQAEFAEFFQRENGVALSARSLKEESGPDRLGIDEWKAAKAAMEAEEAAARQRAAEITDEAESEASRVQIRIQASEQRQVRKEAEADKLRSSLSDALTAINALGERLRGLYDDLRSILPGIRRTIWARDSSPQQVADAKGARKTTIPKLAQVRASMDRSRKEAEALQALAQDTPENPGTEDMDRFEI